MRAFVLLLTAFVAVSVAVVLAPDLVPPPLRAEIISVRTNLTTIIADRLGAQTKAPVWPDALDKAAHQRAMLVQCSIAAGIASVALGAGLLLWRFRRRGDDSASMPAWLATARTLASASSDRKLRWQECKQLEATILPDLRARGEAALARAHQMDLYWRYVSRTQTGGMGAPSLAETERLRAAAKRTLSHIAGGAPARALPAFRDAKSSLWALEAGDARELKRYYDEMGALLDRHAKALAAAQAATDSQKLDPAALLQSMEDLRQINRMIARESAALVGDLKISVRAID